MTTLQQVYEKAQQFANEVETAILNHEFTFISRGPHTSLIEVCDTKMEIWTAGDGRSTNIYRIGIDPGQSSDYPRHKFSEPVEVFNVLVGYSVNNTEDVAEEHY